MRARLILLVLIAAMAGVATGCAQAPQAPTDAGSEPSTSTAAVTGAPEGWGQPTDWLLPTATALDPTVFVSEVDNPFWPLAPGMRWTYEAATEEGTESIEVVVQDEKREIMGIDCTVVRDTVKLNGQVIEDTFDWYAQDEDGNVWYMGEAVDNYENGKVVDHDGSWEAGVDGALPGIKMWAQPYVGQPAYYQEFLEGEAEDLGKDLAADGTATVPLGSYSGLVVIEEWTPLDPEFVERKYYARGIGAVKEEMVRGGTEVVGLTSFTTR